MSRVPAPLLVVPVLLLADARLAAAQEGPPPADRIARIEARLYPAVTLAGTPDAGWSVAERMRRWQVPGLSVAMIHEGRVAWVRAYGVRAPGGQAAVTPRTLFQAGSLSKPVAALLALDLVEDGVLGLDEDVNARLRGWRLPADSFTAAQPVTLRLLLAHRAGITVSGFDGYRRGARLPTLRQVLDGRAPATSEPIRVARRPGSAVQYSGGGYVVMQQLIEDAAGRGFAALAAERVLRPLGMARSTFAVLPAAAARGDVARGTLADGRPVPGGWKELPEQAAASLWSTPAEYAAVVRELQRAARGAGTVLGAATARAMLTVQGDPASQQGLGVGLKGVPPFRVSHTGWNDGFRSLMIGYLDRDEGIVLMANGDAADELLMEYVRAVAREYGWADVAPAIRDTVPVTALMRAEVTGRWRLGNDREIEVTDSAGRLLAGPRGRRLLPLHAASADEYFFTFSDGVGLRVRRDSTGTVQGVTWQQGTREVPGTRVAP